jgi:hypothetical protein
MYFVKYANWFTGNIGARVLLLFYLAVMGISIYNYSISTVHFLFFGVLAFELIVDPLSKKYRNKIHLLGKEIVLDLQELIKERGL